jgi:hypothetical protein
MTGVPQCLDDACVALAVLLVRRMPMVYKWTARDFAGHV